MRCELDVFTQFVLLKSWLITKTLIAEKSFLRTERVLLRQLGNGFPWGTLAVNLSGSFLAGFLVVWLEGRGPQALYWRAFLIVGLLGGLTTYSALMLECLLLARSPRGTMALAYLGTTLVLGLLLVWLGARAAGMMRSPFPGI